VKTVAIYNIKGGVGKTATTVNLAYLCAQEGARTLVWDLDPQAAATFYFRVRPRLKGGTKGLLRGRRRVTSLVRGTDYEWLDLLPADFSNRKLDTVLQRSRKPRKQLARLLEPFAGLYDYLFVDCAPSASLVSEGVFVAADALLVPTIPTTLCLRTLARLRKHIRAKISEPPHVLPFLCMVDLRTSLHREICEQIQREGGFLASRIPYSAAVEQMGLHRAPLPAYAPRSGPARAYQSLWREVKATLNDPQFGPAPESFVEEPMLAAKAAEEMRT
jgi:cellulose biosynthesis protein BcsQ